jgi:hypothetical protein
MTVGTVTDLGHNAVSGTNTTLAVTTGAAINANDLVIVVGSGAVNGTAPTAFVDSGGTNVYTTVVINNSISPCLTFGYCFGAASLSSGGTITGTYSATNARKAITAFTVAGMKTTAAVLDPAATATQQTGAATSITAVSVKPVFIQSLVAGAWADSSTNPGTFSSLNSFTQIGGTTATTFLIPFYKIITTFGTTVSFGPSWTNSAAARTGLITFDAADSTAAGGPGILLLGVG